MQGHTLGITTHPHLINLPITKTSAAMLFKITKPVINIGKDSYTEKGNTRPQDSKAALDPGNKEQTF